MTEKDLVSTPTCVRRRPLRLLTTTSMRSRFSPVSLARYAFRVYVDGFSSLVDRPCAEIGQRPAVPEISPVLGTHVVGLDCFEPWTDALDHVNTKEARVCLMSLRRLRRSVDNVDTTCLTLSDNMV